MIAVEKTTPTIGKSVAQACVSSEPVDPAREINGIIDDVVDQTNLMVLSAALDATRGGGGASRMAIVVDAIRHMAERAARATEEINVLINSQPASEQRSQLLSQRASLALDDVKKSSEAVLETLQQVAQMPVSTIEAADEASRDHAEQSDVTLGKSSGGSK